MIYSRTEREQHERETLAPYAIKSKDSRGRRFPEDQSPRRTAFQRDRDRIVNCRAFRRLEYKTQVFVNTTADHYRTRLTHTIEMVSVARTLARALNVNEDLTGAIALAHDIGHSPFGHSGERKLNELMKDHGGFDHNVQSLRWIDALEHSYPYFDGLNPTWEVRAGLMKHEAGIPHAALDSHAVGPFQFVEAQIADVADDIAYQANDVEDGLAAGLITTGELDKLELWQRSKERVLQAYPNCPEDRLLTSTIRCLFSLQIEDVLKHAEQSFDSYKPASFLDVMNAPGRLVCFSEKMKHLLIPYRDYLFNGMYHHADVVRADTQAVHMMEKLFMFYIENPKALGKRFTHRIAKEGLWRTACDYVSGATDRYALERCKFYGLV